MDLLKTTIETAKILGKPDGVPLSLVDIGSQITFPSVFLGQISDSSESVFHPHQTSLPPFQADSAQASLLPNMKERLVNVPVLYEESANIDRQLELADLPSGKVVPPVHTGVERAQLENKLSLKGQEQAQLTEQASPASLRKANLGRVTGSIAHIEPGGLTDNIDGANKPPHAALTQWQMPEKNSSLSRFPNESVQTTRFSTETLQQAKSTVAHAHEEARTLNAAIEPKISLTGQPLTVHQVDTVSFKGGKGSDIQSLSSSLPLTTNVLSSNVQSQSNSMDRKPDGNNESLRKFGLGAGIIAALPLDEQIKSPPIATQAGLAKQANIERVDVVSMDNPGLAKFSLDNGAKPVFPLSMNAFVGNRVNSGTVGTGKASSVSSADAVSSTIGESTTSEPGGVVGAGALQAASPPSLLSKSGQSHFLGVAQFHDVQFARNLNDQVLLMAGQGIQKAHISLSPQELGPVEIRLSVLKDEVSVQLASVNPIVRDTIEEALPKLRELFAEAGLKLAEHDVSSNLGGGNSPTFSDSQEGKAAHEWPQTELEQELAVTFPNANPSSSIDTYI